MSDLKRAAFIILSYNSAAYIEACLESVSGLTCVEPRVYLCDNGSSDESVSVIKNFASNCKRGEGFLTLLEKPQNEGTTKPRNELIQLSFTSEKRFDYIVVLDSDTVISDDAMSKLFGALDSDASLSLVAPRMFNGSNVEQMSVKRFPSFAIKFLKALPIDALSKKGAALEKYDFFPASSFVDAVENSKLPICSDENIYVADYAISACWVMRACDIARFGYLDEYYFYAPEDVDYCANIMRAGGKVALVSNASIYHLTQRISKRKLFSKMNFLHIKGLLYFARKHRKTIRASRKRK